MNPLSILAGVKTSTFLGCVHPVTHSIGMETTRSNPIQLTTRPLLTLSQCKDYQLEVIGTVLFGRDALRTLIKKGQLATVGHTRKLMIPRVALEKVLGVAQ
jgi:hypothetical protein